MTATPPNPSDVARRALAATTRLVESATPGPLWVSPTLRPTTVFSGAGIGEDSMVATEMSKPDARLLVCAPIVISKLAAGVEAVLDLHSPYQWRFGDRSGTWCYHCDEITYPCPTVRAILESVDSIPDAIRDATA